VLWDGGTCSPLTPEDAAPLVYQDDRQREDPAQAVVRLRDRLRPKLEEAGIELDIDLDGGKLCLVPVMRAARP
jgi:hypothetical protein